MESFLGPVQRSAWARDKGMQVFQLWSDEHQETFIDVFVMEPFDFDVEPLRLRRPADD